MPEHETKRLKLIQFSLELMKIASVDKHRLADQLGVHIPDAWPGQDFAEALPFFIGEKEKHPSDTWDGLVIHKDDNTVIGDIGFKGPPDQAGCVEIGYSIIPQYRNQGYATEATLCLIQWALQQRGITRVTAQCLPDNVGSIKVLRRVGMSQVAGEDDDLLYWETPRVET